MSFPADETKETSIKPTWLSRLWVLIRSSIVGILATVSDLSTLFVLIHGAGLSEQSANVPSLLPGLLVQFVGNKFFAFEDRSRAIVKQGVVFLAIEGIAFGLNAVAFDRLVSFAHVHWIIARLLGTNLVYLGFSFPMWSYFVFRYGAKPEP